MSPHDPYEVFRQSAEQERPFSFQEEDWNDLEQRLETAFNPNTKTSPSPWWLLLLLLPVFGLLLSLHNRGQEQYAINHQLLSEIEQLRNELSIKQPTATIIKHDTVILERIVYRNHPVKDVELIRGSHPLYGKSKFSAFHTSSSITSVGSLQSISTPLLTEAPTSPFPLFATKKNIARSFPKEEEDTVASPIEKSPHQLLVSQLPPEAIAQLALEDNFLEGLPDVHPFLLPPRKIKQPLIRSVDLTLVGDGSIAAKPPQANLLSVRLDARLNARLGRGWMAFAGLAARISIYELDNPVASLGIPSVAPPAEGYVFKELQVEEVSNWWLLGVGWELPSRKRWRPFLEVSYRKSSSHVSELAYAFHRSDGPEIITEIDATLTPRPQNRLIGGAGFWYVPKRSTLRLGLGSTWSVPLRTDLLNQPRLGLNARLGFDF